MVRRTARGRGVGTVAECRTQGKRHLAEMLESSIQQGRTKVQKRRLLGKFSRQAQKKKLAKLRKHNCTKQRLVDNERREKTLQRKSSRLKMITWNVRGWGAQYSQYDIVAKTQSLLDLLNRQGVGLAVLTDIKFRYHGIREYRTPVQTWMVLCVGRVAFAMTSRWYQWWQIGGGKFWTSSSSSGSDSRVAGLYLGRQGWKRGLFVVGLYAPTSDASVGERRELRRQVVDMLGHAPGTAIRLVTGDFNAEFGRPENGDWGDVLGPHGYPRRSPPGGEWLDWCRESGFIDAASQFAQNNRGTWTHPRYGTTHALDHWLLDGRHQWHLTQCRAFHAPPGRQEESAWLGYTDHSPLVLTLRQGKMWLPRASTQRSTPKPDVAKLWGVGNTVSTFRRQFEEEITNNLQTMRTQGPEEALTWTQVVQVCNQAALRVLGEAEVDKVRPWLEGHWEELKQLDATVAAALQRDRQVRQGDQPWDEAQQLLVYAERRTLNQARRVRRRKLSEWETSYWSQLAAQALQAERERNLGELFRLHKLLGAHTKLRQGDGSRVLPTDLDAEREAWKVHFEAIQAGAGEVADRVWANIPRVGEQARWLEMLPTKEEVERCVGQMQNRRASGEDGFMAEFLKYGGSSLQQELHLIVVRAWQYSMEAEAGQEARF